jgi:transcriptional regulator with PAS, ATPase and Fis domain
MGLMPPHIAPDAMQVMQRYVWPGNIRELHNVIERAVLLCGDEGEITVDHLPLEKLTSEFAQSHANRNDSTAPIAVGSSDEERARIVDALEKCAGNQTYAARMLGIARSTLVVKMTAYNLPRPRAKKPQ